MDFDMDAAGWTRAEDNGFEAASGMAVTIAAPVAVQGDRDINMNPDYWLHADGLLWLIGWLTLALVNAGLAQGKQRRGWLWFLLSLPFGPLATLALVLLPVRPRHIF